MRNFSTGVARNLRKKQGIEPVVFIGVQWVDGRESFYCSTEFPGTRKSLVSVSGMETTHRIEGSGSSQSVSVVLSDTDGKLSSLMDQADIHKRPAKVYMGFPDVPVSQAIVLLDGEVNSEVTLDERARTLSFSILSKIEGRLFGFSAEDGLFQDVDPQTRKRPWPFRFGDTCAYPTVNVQSGRTGELKLGQGVMDLTLDAKICQTQKINCPLIDDNLCEVDSEKTTRANAQLARNTWVRVITDDTPYHELDNFGYNNVYGVKICQDGTIRRFGSTFKRMIPDPECQRAKRDTLCKLYQNRANQLVYVKETLAIRGGEDFPQMQTVDIRVGSVLYTGRFEGETFYIDKTNRLDRPAGVIDCSTVQDVAKGYRRVEKDLPSSLADCQKATDGFELKIVGGAVEAWEKLGEIEDSKFIWLPAGTKVHLASTDKQVHVVSMVPGTVTGVYAYRKLGDSQQLTALPTSYYEVITTDYDGLEVMEIWLNRPLSAYPDENWQETIYTTFDSDIGPNPTDVIEWIVERYTDFEIDTDNFAAISTKLAKYPCNLYYAAKRNVLDILNQIAYEARCALIVTDNVVRLRYLSTTPDVDKTLTNADIVAGSFLTKLSKTEDLITSRSVTWEPWGASMVAGDPHELNLTVESNVEKYGFFGGSKTYDTINNEEQALKTATFWSIRDSNTWKMVEFSTTLEHMDAELFDCLRLNTSLFPDIKVVVRNMSIDLEQGTVRFLCWTPILSGTKEEYIWAWPGSQAAGRPYPNNNFEVPEPKIPIRAPVGHPLYIPGDNPGIAATWGDRFPSDADDTNPLVSCQDVNSPELVDTIEPIFEDVDIPDTAQQAAKAQKAYRESGSGGGGAPIDDENLVCGRSSMDSCVWEVTVQYATATSIAKGSGSGFNCSTEGGSCKTTDRGARCGGPTFFWCRTFGSDLMAAGFADSIRHQIENDYCKWAVGNQGPVDVIGPIKRSSGDDPKCVGMGDVEVGQGLSSLQAAGPETGNE